MIWYAKKAGNDSQGLVIDEATGRTVAVTYEAHDAALLAAAPDLLAVLSKILAAHKSANNGAVMGEAVLCGYFAEAAEYAIAKAKGE